MVCQEESGDESFNVERICDFQHDDNSPQMRKRHNSECIASRLYSNEQKKQVLKNNEGSPYQSVEEKNKLEKCKLWSHQGNEVNLNRFLRFHPGGTPALKECRGQDLGLSMRSSPHSSEAYYLLRDFYNGNKEEDIVDWSKPMLGQVGRLGQQYSFWVWSPVDRPLRLFHYDWAEKLTRTNWKQVIGVWVPVIAAALVLSFYYAPSQSGTLPKIILVLTYLTCGMAVWPLLEYSIHRWLFHLQPPKQSPLLITLHFGLHGLHHKVPFDEGRLLFPPGPCTVMALALYQIYTSIFPWWVAMAFFSGTMLGYLIYDLIHYYLHHGSPKEGSYLYNMKRYHNQHHFAQQEKGFGISSSFWDRVFNTIIKLKKLPKTLTWES